MALGRKDAARAALGTVERLHPAHVEPILSALDAAGLLDRPNTSECMRWPARCPLPRLSRERLTLP